MQPRDTSKMYPCWRTYKEGQTLPVLAFHNGRRIDLATAEVKELLANLPKNNMVLFSDHLYYGRYQPLSGKSVYSYGSNFSVSKNDDGSVCVFGNGCLFE